MLECKTDFRWPKSYFPAHVCVVDEKNGKEKDFALVLDGGKLTVRPFEPETEPAASEGPAGAGATAEGKTE